MESRRRPLTKKEKKQLEKRRKQAAEQAKKYHKAQARKSAAQADKARSAQSRTAQNRKSVQGRPAQGDKARSNQAQSKKPQSRQEQRRSQRDTRPQANGRSSENFRDVSSSKIERAVNSRPKDNIYELSREERYLRSSEQKIRNLEPKDFDDGYYVDEYGERKRQQRRAQEIHKQEAEVIHRRKKPLTPKQIKRRRFFIYSGIFAVVLIIGAVLCLTVLFKTENIIVDGGDYYSDEQITEYSGVEYQQNIFIAALLGTPEDIQSNLPYVESASISFTVPDTITIKITDAVPAYVIKNGSGYLLISSKGRILESVAENEDNLPQLVCEELESTEPGGYVSFSDDNVPDILQQISESLENNEVELSEITEIDVTDTANIGIVYDGRIDINLGLPEDIDYKIRTAITIIDEKLDPNGTGTITGTLDVSTCNTNKMSHYKPAETSETATSATDPTATESDAEASSSSE